MARAAELETRARCKTLLAITLLSVTCGQPRLRPPGANGAGAAPGSQAGGASGAPGFALPPASAPPSADAGAPPPGGGTCAAEVREAGRLPVDLLFVVDKSLSMSLEIGKAGRQWDLVREALMKFVQDPRSNDLGVGLQLFPLVPRNIVCAQNSDCTAPEPCDPPRASCSGTGRPCAMVGQPCGGGAGDVCTEVPRTCHSKGFPQCNGNYADPVVPVAPLPAGRLPFATRLMYTEPEGQTPMGPAMSGGVTYLRQRRQAGVSRRAALVLATDGFPLGCGEQIPDVAAIIAGGQADNPAISTFVIGVFDRASNAQATLDQLARAGGSGQAIIVEPNADLSARFLAALERIRQAALPCEFDIPAPQNGPLDFAKVNLRWKSATAMEDVPYVELPERCDPARGGWYYDVPPSMGRPSRVLVCPTSCERFKSEQAATVELSFGCQTRTID